MLVPGHGFGHELATRDVDGSFVLLIAQSNNLMGDFAVFPAKHLGPLAFKIFVDGKEVLYLSQNVRLNLCAIVDVAESGIAGRAGDNLLVSNALIEHLEETNRPRVIDAAGESGSIPKHQNIQRVTVLGESPRNESVVSGIMNWRMKISVETKHAQFLVVFVFVNASLRNLDDGGHHVRCVLTNGNVQIVAQLLPLSLKRSGSKENPYALVGVISLPYTEAFKGGFLRHKKVSTAIEETATVDSPTERRISSPWIVS